MTKSACASIRVGYTENDNHETGHTISIVIAINRGLQCKYGPFVIIACVNMHGRDAICYNDALLNHACLQIDDDDLAATALGHERKVSTRHNLQTETLFFHLLKTSIQIMLILLITLSIYRV
jgi:hypothetical protein